MRGNSDTAAARRWRSRGPRALAVALAIACATVARAEIIDRVLAVVGDHVITLSDARAALRLELVPPEVSADPIAAVMQRLIDRRLMLVEVERYAPAEPPAARVDAALGEVQARLGGPAALEAALKETAMSRDDLRLYVRDSLRIDAYLQQRFALVSEPSEQDLAAYYREHPEGFTRDGVLRPLQEVRSDVAAAILRERRAALASEWLAGLRRRTSPIVLYLPGS